MTSKPPVFPVRFDDAALDEDLLHVTPRGRSMMIVLAPSRTGHGGTGRSQPLD